MRAILSKIAYLLFLIPLLSCDINYAPAKAPVKEAVELLPTEVDAVGWAFDALLKYPESEWPYIRFVWLPGYADEEWIKALDLAINLSVSHTPVLIKGDLHAGGYLIAYNLKTLVPDPIKLKETIRIWDSLAQEDSKFHLSKINIDNEGNTVVLAPHLQEAVARQDAKDERLDTLVTKLTASTGAIYPYEFLLEQLLTSVRGKYPEFRQVADLDLKTLLQQRGFDIDLSKDFIGERAVYLNKSGVTGKPRIVLAVFGNASGRPLVLTYDIKDLRVESKEQFIRNLLNFDKFFDANEIFIPMSNGLVEYILTDGKGNIQRVAPPDIVADTKKPDGHTTELEMGMSCISCHYSFSGYRTNRNDADFIIGSSADPLSEGEYLNHRGTKITKEEAIAILVARYARRLDEPDGVLGRAERDFVYAVQDITSYDLKDQDAVQRSGAKIKEIYHTYRYAELTHDRICLELGVKVPKGTGNKVLRVLVPDLPEGTQEDPLIPMLKNGMFIVRDQMAQIETELALRAINNRAKVK